MPEVQTLSDYNDFIKQAHFELEKEKFNLNILEIILWCKLDYQTVN